MFSKEISFKIQDEDGFLMNIYDCSLSIYKL